MDMSLSKLWEIVKVREAWRAAVHGVAKSQTWLSDWTTTILRPGGVTFLFQVTESDPIKISPPLALHQLGSCPPHTPSHFRMEKISLGWPWGPQTFALPSPQSKAGSQGSPTTHMYLEAPHTHLPSILRSQSQGELAFTVHCWETVSSQRKLSKVSYNSVSKCSWQTLLLFFILTHPV